MSVKKKVLVSSCLLGEKCRYNGSGEEDAYVLEYIKDMKVYPVCPEVMGGMSTPRSPCEIYKGRVVSKVGEDTTDYFESGANMVVDLAKQEGINLAVFKSRSPSCGCGQIYDGTFNGILIQGDGICVKKLKENGIQVINNEELKKVV